MWKTFIKYINNYDIGIVPNQQNTKNILAAWGGEGDFIV